MPRFTKEYTIEEFKKIYDAELAKQDEPDIRFYLEEGVGNSKVVKDLSKYDFIYSMENLIDKTEQYFKENFGGLPYFNFPLLGYNKIDDVTFIGFLGGADYTLPIFFILYLDQNGKLRGYIPYKGNALNPLNKSLIGEDSDFDNTFALNQGLTTDDLFSNKHTFLDEALLKEDILKRIIKK
jgi:hypothetical protein